MENNIPPETLKAMKAMAERDWPYRAGATKAEVDWWRKIYLEGLKVAHTVGDRAWDDGYYHDDIFVFDPTSERKAAFLASLFTTTNDKE